MRYSITFSFSMHDQLGHVDCDSSVTDAFSCGEFHEKLAERVEQFQDDVHMLLLERAREKKQHIF